MRHYLQRVRKNEVSFFEAEGTNIDAEKKTLKCVTSEGKSFEVPYDKLVLAVGSAVNDFEVPGVKENCNFLRSIEGMFRLVRSYSNYFKDTRAIKNKLISCFETAALPSTAEAERQKKLSFVVVGGGASGIKFSVKFNGSKASLDSN